MQNYNLPGISSFGVKIPELPKIDTPVQHMWADEQFKILRSTFKNLKNHWMLIMKWEL